MKAIKELWLFLCIMVALLLALSGKANSAEHCAPVDVVKWDMAQEQFRIVRIDFDEAYAIVTYQRYDERIQWVFLPSGKACLFNERLGGS